MMILLLSVGIFSLLAGLLFAFFLRPIAINLGIVDKPNQRKQHFGEVPLIGGPLILLVTLFGALLLPYALPKGIFIAGGLITLLGLMDDKFDVPAKIKLALQIGIASFAVYIDQSMITDIGVLQNWFANPELRYLHYGLAVLAIVIGVNALNLIDGIDGLAASIVLVILLNANLAFVYAGVPLSDNFLIYSALMAGALCSFLVFNLGLIDGKKVFLGDSGSMLVGLFITGMLIAISQEPVSVSGNTIPASLCLWLTAVPMIDMLVTFVRRIMRGKSVLAPDRTHLHHRLRDIGLSKWYVLLVILVGSSLIFWAGATITLHFGEAMSLLAYIVYSIGHIILVIALDRYQNKAKLAVAE